MDFLKISSLVILCFISFLLGHHLATEKCKVSLQDLEIASNNALIQDLERQKERTETISTITVQAQGKVNEDRNSVENKFSLLNSSSLFNPEWVHANSDSKDSADLSYSSRTSAGTKQETQCRCPRDNGKELQRIRKLYAAELKKAKECDLAVVQLNEIIEYYNKLRIAISQ